MTPRDKFRQNKDLVSGYNGIIDSPQMQAAFEAAMLEYIFKMPVTNSDDPQIAAANDFRRQGAQGFVITLLGLNSSTPPQTKKTDAELDHKI